MRRGGSDRAQTQAFEMALLFKFAEMALFKILEWFSTHK